MVKTEDTEVLGRQKVKQSKIKGRSSRSTCKNCSYQFEPWCRILWHRDSSVNRPTWHLRYGQLEVRGVEGGKVTRYKTCPITVTQQKAKKYWLDRTTYISTRLDRNLSAMWRMALRTWLNFTSRNCASVSSSYSNSSVFGWQKRNPVQTITASSLLSVFWLAKCLNKYSEFLYCRLAVIPDLLMEKTGAAVLTNYGCFCWPWPRPWPSKEVRIFLFGTVKNSSHCAVTSVFSNCLNWPHDSPHSLRLGGRLFQTCGPAAAKVLSPKPLRIQLTMSVRVLTECSCLTRASATSGQSSAR